MLRSGFFFLLIYVRLLSVGGQERFLVKTNFLYGLEKDVLISLCHSANVFAFLPPSLFIPQSVKKCWFTAFMRFGVHKIFD
jgi:hypothetical protein